MHAVACRERNKSNNGLGLSLYKIADCVRMCFSSAPNRRSARTGRRPRKPDCCSSKYSPASADVGARSLRAPRANRVFRADEKRIRTENTVLVNNKDDAGSYPRSPIGCGCAFHPRQFATWRQPWCSIPAAGGKNCRRMPRQALKCASFTLLIRTLPESTAHNMAGMLDADPNPQLHTNLP